MTKTTLCPYCLTASPLKELLFQCSSSSQHCAPSVNKTLAKIWNITSPKPLIFKGKSHLSSSPKCPQCHHVTSTQCCPLCARQLPKNITSKHHSHIVCITNNRHDCTLFYQTLYQSIELYLSNQMNILLEANMSTSAPFMLSLTLRNQTPHTLVFHVIPWQNITHHSVATLQQYARINAIFLPCQPPESLTPALHALHKYTNTRAHTAFIAQNSYKFLSHISPNHLFFRHTPHHLGYNKDAAKGLSQAIQDMLTPLWGAHAMSYIEKHFKSYRFFVETTGLTLQNTIVPQGWKIDEFLLWALNTL